MSTSDSSDSDSEPDLDKVYPRVTGEHPGASKSIDHGVSQDEIQNTEDHLKKILEKAENSATQIKVKGQEISIFPGPHIHINTAPAPPPPPPDDFPENIEETKRLEKIVGGIRDYYAHYLMVLSPLPYLRSSTDINHVELVIKQISSGGRVDRWVAKTNIIIELTLSSEAKIGKM